MSHLRHPPALWQALSVQPLCTVLFNSFRCLNAGSCAHDWDCCFRDTLAYCPEWGVRILVQRCAALPFLLLSHHPPDCASCATVLGNIFTAVHLPPLGGFFSFFPSGSPVSGWFFQPSLPLRLVGVLHIYGFIAVPVPEAERQSWGNPTTGFAGFYWTYTKSGELC